MRWINKYISFLRGLLKELNILSNSRKMYSTSFQKNKCWYIRISPSSMSNQANCDEIYGKRRHTVPKYEERSRNITWSTWFNSQWHELIDERSPRITNECEMFALISSVGMIGNKWRHSYLPTSEFSFNDRSKY